MKSVPIAEFKIFFPSTYIINPSQDFCTWFEPYTWTLKWTVWKPQCLLIHIGRPDNIESLKHDSSEIMNTFLISSGDFNVTASKPGVDGGYFMGFEVDQSNYLGFPSASAGYKVFIISIYNMHLCSILKRIFSTPSHYFFYNFWMRRNIKTFCREASWSCVFVCMNWCRFD